MPTDWTLSATETTSGIGFEGVSGSDAVTSVAVPAGEYVITELPGPAGYVPLG